MLARRFSLEVVPVVLSLLFLTLFILYRLAMTPRVENGNGQVA